jgi:nicotinamidase-related amidase
LQNWTLSLPLAPHPASGIVETAFRLATRFKEQGGFVVLVHVGFSTDFSDAPKGIVDVPLAIPEGGLPPQAADFVPPIADFPADLVVLKRQWSAFFGTELDLQLRRRNISTILLGGVMTNFGVESTARDAWQLGYSTIVVEEACGAFTDEMHRFAIRNTLPRVSRVRSSEQVLEALHLQPA